MTSTQPRTELDPKVANLVARGRQIAAAIAPLSEQLDEIKAELRTLLAPGTHAVDGRPAVTIKASGQWSPDQARTVLTAEQLAACTVETLDSKLAKALLAPQDYAACTRPKAHSIEFPRDEQ